MQTKVGLIGNNISYSISPVFHNYWLSELKINAIYNKIDISANLLTKDYLFNLIKQGYIGFNVTIPYKESILSLVNKCSSSVEEIKACNTLYLQDLSLVASNTDIFGFIVPLLSSTDIDFSNIEHININLKKVQSMFKTNSSLINIFKEGSNALLIGAGGATRAIVYALLKSNINEILIINRDINKAKNLEKDFNNQRIKVIKDLKDINNVSLVINSTPLSNKSPFNFSFKNLLKKDCLFYDLIYNPKITNFLLQAEQEGFKILNGLPMLIIQGALSFNYWFKILPKIDKNLINIINKSIKNT